MLHRIQQAPGSHLFNNNRYDYILKFQVYYSPRVFFALSHCDWWVWGLVPIINREDYLTGSGDLLYHTSTFRRLHKSSRANKFSTPSRCSVCKTTAQWGQPKQGPMLAQIFGRKFQSFCLRGCWQLKLASQGSSILYASGWRIQQSRKYEYTCIFNIKDIFRILVVRVST